MRKNAEANRERILAAAEEIFGTKGASGSTEEVAARAEVGIATVFRNFPTKDALIEAALLRHFAALHERADALAAHADPVHALHELLAVMIGTGGNKLTLSNLLRDRDNPPGPVVEVAKALRDKVGAVLARAQRAGVADPEVSVDELYFLLRGLSEAAAARPPTPRTVEHAVRIVQRGIAPAP